MRIMKMLYQLWILHKHLVVSFFIFCKQGTALDAFVSSYVYSVTLIPHSTGCLPDAPFYFSRPWLSLNKV